PLRGRKDRCHMKVHAQRVPMFVLAVALGVTLLPWVGRAATVTNPICTIEDAFYSPGNGEDIIVPDGFKVSVFAKDLNQAVGIAFTGNDRKFSVYVLESGHGLPSICNDEENHLVGGTFSATNPFTPDILVFDQDGNKIAGPLAKPTSSGGGLLPH